LVGAETLRQAEELIVGCEVCSRRRGSPLR